MLKQRSQCCCFLKLYHGMHCVDHIIALQVHAQLGRVNLGIMCCSCVANVDKSIPFCKLLTIALIFNYFHKILEFMFFLGNCGDCTIAFIFASNKFKSNKI
jgi:hypothetical protein